MHKMISKFYKWSSMLKLRFPLFFSLKRD